MQCVQCAAFSCQGGCCSCLIELCLAMMLDADEVFGGNYCGEADFELQIFVCCN